eukprot:237656_1
MIKKKSKGTQQQPAKHWLECNCQLFEKDIPSLNINLLYNDSPKMITSEKKNDENENEENDENKYYLDWNFNSKYLLSESCMTDIKRSTNSTIQIIHKYEEIDENEEVKIIQDPNHLCGDIDIQLLFDSVQSTQSIQLVFEDMKNEDMKNEQAATIEITLSLHKSFKQYFDALNSKIHFKDIIMTQKQQNNEEKATESTESTESTDVNNDVNTQKCVNDIIHILVNEHIKFMEKTSVQQYDNARMKQEFVYHLNSTGLYGELKEKLIKPTVSEYIDKMPLNTMYEQLLGSMISDLSNNATSNDAKPIPNDIINNKICVKKQIEIANDFEIQKMMSNAYTHYKMAFDLTRKLNEDFHWESVKNLVKILIKQKEINEIIFILTDFISNQSNQINQIVKNESLLFLSAILIENNHENAKCVIYKLCDQCGEQFNVISLMLKAVFFKMNNDETRSHINFRRAINLLNTQMNSNDSNQPE